MEKIDEVFSEENETNQTPRRDSSRVNVSGAQGRNHSVVSGMSITHDNSRILEDINEDAEENYPTDGN